MFILEVGRLSLVRCVGLRKKEIEEGLKIVMDVGFREVGIVFFLRKIKFG